MQKLTFLLLFLTLPSFSQTFTTPIGSATGNTLVSSAMVRQWVDESVEAMNRPGGMERFAVNTLKAGLGVDELPSGTASITVSKGKYALLFGNTPATKSLWYRTVLDPLIWDIKHNQMGRVSPDAYPAAVAAATYVVKNPARIEYYLQKADYETRKTEANVELKENW